MIIIHAVENAENIFLKWDKFHVVNSFPGTLLTGSSQHILKLDKKYKCHDNMTYK